MPDGVNEYVALPSLLLATVPRVWLVLPKSQMKSTPAPLMFELSAMSVIFAVRSIVSFISTM